MEYIDVKMYYCEWNDTIVVEAEVMDDAGEDYFIVDVDIDGNETVDIVYVSTYYFANMEDANNGGEEMR